MSDSGPVNGPVIPVHDTVPADAPLRPSADRRRPGFIAYLYATIGVGVAAVIAAVLQLLPHANLSLVFLTAVVIVAARFGLGPSLYAGLLSFLVYNFVFTPPLYTFNVASEGDVATLVFFLAMAALSGNLAARARAAVDKRESALQHISYLDAFLRRMTAAANIEEISRVLAEHVANICDRPVTVLLPGDQGALTVTARHHGASIAADDPAIAGAWSEPGPLRRVPWGSIITLTGARGVLGLVAVETKTPLAPEPMQLTVALCEQAAVAMDRARLVDDVEKARIAAETEQLRSALLSSVSHDLRTPLASIIGSTTSLIEYGESIGDDDRRTLQRTVLDEAQRLDRYIQNLLDMTRLGHGRTPLKRGWHDLGDMIAAAMERLGVSVEGKELNIDISPQVSLLWVHGALIEQLLVNLLDNAARFSPPGGKISVDARRAEDSVIIDVTDQGPGIPAADRERVFDMFYRVAGADRRDTGTGLGLAICRGLAGAHGGTIEALPGPGGRGTTIRVTLPFHAPPATDDE